MATGGGHLIERSINSLISFGGNKEKRPVFQWRLSTRQNLGFPQSIFVGIILILVNGHPRGGVSAFFREISAFFLIQNFVKFHAFPTCG